MDNRTLARLRKSIQNFGLVTNLVVRKIAGNTYEVLSGNQRLALLTEMGYSPIPCVIVDLDDAKAKLLAQALNHIHGEDDLGLQAKLMQEVIKSIPARDIMSVLPVNPLNLISFQNLGQTDIANYLNDWQKRQEHKLKHMQFQFTHAQEEIVEKALNKLLPAAKQNQGANPNARSTALYLLCKYFLERMENDG